MVTEADTAAAGPAEPPVMGWERFLRRGAEAEALGLVSRVVPDDGLAEAAAAVKEKVNELAELD